MTLTMKKAKNVNNLRQRLQDYATKLSTTIPDDLPEEVFRVIDGSVSVLHMMVEALGYSPKDHERIDTNYRNELGKAIALPKTPMEIKYIADDYARSSKRGKNLLAIRKRLGIEEGDTITQCSKPAN